MPSVFAAAIRSLDTFRIPGLWGLFLLCVALNLLLLLSVFAGIHMLLASTTWFASPFAEASADVAGNILGATLAWFLFPVLLPLIAGLFLESVAGRVEKHDYQLPQAPEPDSVAVALGGDIWFAVKALLLNLICMPLYFIPLINIAIYYGLNGYLLGREFFVMGAARHVGRKQAEILRKQYRSEVFLAGMLIAGAITIPLLNLLAPFLGVAMMVHLYQGLKRSRL